MTSLPNQNSPVSYASVNVPRCTKRREAENIYFRYNSYCMASLGGIDREDL